MPGMVADPRPPFDDSGHARERPQVHAEPMGTGNRLQDQRVRILLGGVERHPQTQFSLSHPLGQSPQVHHGVVSGYLSVTHTS